jgi:AcrR family transcriptional regulator
VKKQERGLVAVDRVLDAALACFTREGVGGVTIQEIAEESGVSVGSIYHHFGSRERILFALHCKHLEAMLASIAMAVYRHRSARGGVCALVRSYIDFVASHPHESRFVYAAAYTGMGEELRPQLAALAARVTEPIARWLRPHVEAGRVVDLPPALYEVVLVGPPAEACRRILSGASGMTFASARAALPDLVWAAVAARGPYR